MPVDDRFLKKKKPVKARDLKPGDARKAWAEGPKKPVKSPRAAADLVRKEGSLRSKFADGPKKAPKIPNKPGQKKLMDTLNKSRAANAAARGASAEASVASRAAPRLAGTLLRGAGRLAGPVGALVAMTKEAGAGSDKPSGPLMRANGGTFDKGIRKTTNKFDSGVKLSKLEVIDDAPAAPPKKETPKAAPPKAKDDGFKGNWKKAAPYKPAKNFKEATRRNESDSFLKRKLGLKNGK